MLGGDSFRHLNSTFVMPVFPKPPKTHYRRLTFKDTKLPGGRVKPETDSLSRPFYLQTRVDKLGTDIRLRGSCGFFFILQIEILFSQKFAGTEYVIHSWNAKLEAGSVREQSRWISFPNNNWATTYERIFVLPLKCLHGEMNRSKL